MGDYQSRRDGELVLMKYVPQLPLVPFRGLFGICVLLCALPSCGAIDAGTCGDLALESPNGLYSLKIRHVDGEAPGTHLTVFDLDSALHGAIIRSAPLYGADEYDNPFCEKYPDAKWEGETAVAFGTLSEEKGLESEILLQNATDEMISYVKIRSRELILAFDLGPREERVLRVRNWSPRQRDFEWISAEAVFLDGHQVPDAGANFPLASDATPNRYNIAIGGDRVLVTAAGVPGLKFDKAGSPRAQ